MESIKLILRRISHLFYPARARLLNAYFQSVMLMLLDIGGMTDSLRHPDFICYKGKADVIFHPDSFVLSAVGASHSPLKRTSFNVERNRPLSVCVADSPFPRKIEWSALERGEMQKGVLCERNCSNSRTSSPRGAIQ